METKQETIEEAAEKYFDYNIFCDGITDFEKEISIRSYIEGAKWQQERMYSEDDLIKAYFAGVKSTGEGWNGEYAEGNDPIIEEVFKKGFENWFEPFKNK